MPELKAAAVLGVVVVGAGLAGCTTAFDRHRADLREMVEQGRYDLAAANLDTDETWGLYRKKDRVLWHMDRGAVALANDDADTAFRELDTAERLIESRLKETPGESLGTLLINDLEAPYIGEPYEQIYLNVFKLLAHLEAGRIQGGATVEARRMANLANVLRDRYLELTPKARDRSGLEEGSAAEGGEIERYAAINEAGEFIESPLGLFLSSLAFMYAGDLEDQRVAARRLQQAIESQEGLIGDVDPAPFKGLGELTPESADVVVVAFSGLGPRKEPSRIGPLIIAGAPVYLEIPVLRWSPSRAASARVVVDAAPPSALHLVEDLSRVAETNHKRQLPQVYFRTLARAAAKTAGGAVAVGVVRRSNNDLATLATILGALFLTIATERADVRAWETLPGQAHVGLLDLQPGAHRVRVEWASAAGGVLHATPWREIVVSPGEPVTLVEHYWD